MKKTTIILTLSFASLAVLGWLLSYGNRAQAFGIHISVKDHPEKGITLIGSGDPSFDGMLRAFLKGRTSPLVDALKPFSVFVKNTGNRSVVAYDLKWELVKADGTVASQDVAYANPRALMDGGTPDGEKLETASGLAVAPNAMRLVSLAFSLGQDNVDALFDSQAEVEPKDIDLINKFRNELAQFTDMSISVDGVFFEDGSFIGPNTTKFFDHFKAQLDAYHDVLQAILVARSQNKSPDVIFRGIEALANSPEIVLTSNSTLADYYKFHRIEYAKQLVQMKTKMGAERTIEEAAFHRRKSWAKLHKE